MNRALAARGFPTHPLDAYRAFIGEGVQRLAERVLPAGELRAQSALVADYQDDYARHLLENSTLYQGIPAVLDAVSARGLPMAVLSNKPDAPTRQMVESLLARWHFRAVAGERAGVPRKPDPTSALVLARALEARPEEVAFVGDTLVDVATARAAGMRPLGVLWGFRPLEVAATGVETVRLPEELLPLLLD
jgi:phosphoglycolate phosphatase